MRFWPTNNFELFPAVPSVGGTRPGATRLHFDQRCGVGADLQRHKVKNADDRIGNEYILSGAKRLQ